MTGVNLKLALSRLLAVTSPTTSSRALTHPVFIVGFNKSGKTLLKNILATHPDIIGYPGEANELWHPTLYPWHKSDLRTPPIWMEPSIFVRRSLADWTPLHRLSIRARFGAYQRLSGKQIMLIDSAMIAFMVPALLDLFPGAQFIHFYRDGRVCSYLTARKEHGKIIRHRAKYQKSGYYFQDFNEVLFRLSSYWAATISKIQRDKADVETIGPHNLLELSYEQFCTAPDDILKRICTFLSIPIVSLRSQHVHDTNERHFEEMTADTRQNLLDAIGPTLRATGYLTQ
jgi:hypothetical protein